jgi:tRNA(Arg) A34 adenosine deaminase TadA
VSATEHERFLRQAIDVGIAGARGGRGGPFGAVVVEEGRVLAACHNEVVGRNDPTAHAEVQVIRAACAARGRFQLDGCDVYASCEPCPMCLGALYWARPRAVYYTATRADAAAAGFDDAFIYEELARPPQDRHIPLQRIVLTGAEEPFRIWQGMAGRIKY